MAPDSEMNLPCPLFEGSEKRIEVEFAFGATAPVDGLRSLKREQLNALMSQVRCHSDRCLQMTRRLPVARRHRFLDGLRLKLALGASRLHVIHSYSRFSYVSACLAKRCRVSGSRDSRLLALSLQAACCIVSHRANEDFDAYVLSESSLFVYPERLVLKTCGTTQLLAAVPLLLELAQALDMAACRTKYSRASFLFPEKQVELCTRPSAPDIPSELMAAHACIRAALLDQIPDATALIWWLPSLLCTALAKTNSILPCSRRPTMHSVRRWHFWRANLGT